MNISNSHERLMNNSFYKIVDEQYNIRIAKYIDKGNILDFGCGFGSLVNYLSKNKKTVSIEGIDSDAYSINIAKYLFPKCCFYNTTLKNEKTILQKYDYIILKDVLHHIHQDGLTEEIFFIIRNILNKDGKIIIFDPNVNFIIKTARRIIRHRDAECKYKEAINILKIKGFKIIKTEFYDFFALPISGGFVSICFCPNILLIQKVIMKLNNFLSSLISKTFLKRQLLWRYLIVGQKN